VQSAPTTASWSVALLNFSLTPPLRIARCTPVVRVFRPIDYPCTGAGGWYADTSNMLLFWLCIKLLCEIALFALLGQGVLHLLAGAQRERNAVYSLLQVTTRPLTALARRLTPARVAERHLPWVAGFLLAVLWLVATLEKLSRCLPTLAAGAAAVGCR
jgi:hypothetical protein